MKSNKIYIVLGMHRSGTSAITFALSCLGINLGNDLLPAIENDNQKGYFEDRQIIELNEAILNELNTDWNRLATETQTDTDFNQPRFSSFKIKAIDILRDKLKAGPTAVKDPRFCLLLPFWRSVFHHLNLEVNYVLAVRNPISVTKSLMSGLRGDIDEAKAYFLWLQYVLSAYTATVGENRIVIDYDNLMDDTDSQLIRLAKFIDIKPEIFSENLSYYASEFIDERLRHTRFYLEDIKLFSNCPMPVSEVYAILNAMAIDNISVDDPAAETVLMASSKNFGNSFPLYRYLNKLEFLYSKLDSDINTMIQAVTERDGRIEALGQAVTERDGRIEVLGHLVTERDARIEALGQAVAERDGRIEALGQAVTERDEQIEITRSDLDSYLNSHERLSSNFTKKNEELNHAIKSIEGYEILMDKIYTSTSWRITMPIRFAKDAFDVFIRSPKRIIKLIEILKDARAACGDNIHLIWKVMHVLKDEGVQGIRNRIVILQTRKKQTIYKKDTNYFGQCRNPEIDKAGAMEDISKFPYKPKISIIVPTYNTEPVWLEMALGSVFNQWYTNWELCIVDDASSNEGVIQLLMSYIDFDPRIKIKFNEINQNISVASNNAIEMSAGEYIALLDHDDMLSDDALYWVAKEINTYPDVEILYSDEDKITPTGEITDVFYKPEWSPELLFNCMYIGHLTVYKKKLVLDVGCFRKEFDFSQDYDLALRTTEIAKEIRHIPRILYHWRQAEGSSAQGGKPYARITNIAALQSAIDRRGMQGKAIALPTANRVKIKDWNPKVSIIIPTDSNQNLSASIKAIGQKTEYTNYDIIIVTNTRLIETYTGELLPNIRFVHYDNKYNFSDKCNIGAQASGADIYVFFNDDVRPLNKNWLRDLIEPLYINSVGAVAPKLMYENKSIQHAGLVTGVRGLVGTAFHCLPEDTTNYFCFAQSLRDVSAISGACLGVKSIVFNKVMGFDSVNTPIMHSDVDLSFKVREIGYRCVYTPHSKLLHIGHQSLCEVDKRKEVDEQDKADIYLLKRWAGYISYDPYFTDQMRELLYHDSPEPYLMFGVNNNNKLLNRPDVLVISHDLSMSGAPMIAYLIAKVIKDRGAFPVVYSPIDGPLRKEFEKIKIPVVIDSLLLMRHTSVYKFATNFDCVICNTIVTWPVVYQLHQNKTKTLWYIHEGEYIDHLVNENELLRDTFTKAENIYVGSMLAKKYCDKYTKLSKVLNYGIPDLYSETLIENKRENSLLVVLFGSFEVRKGQDVFLRAIEEISLQKTYNARFKIVGRILDESWFESLKADYAHLNDVEYLGELDRNDYIELLQKTDVVVCSSRDDVLPLVTIDALSLGKTLICSSGVGTSSFLKDGETGYIFQNEDYMQLADILIDILSGNKEIDKMLVRGVYTREFSEESFIDKLLNIVMELSGVRYS